MSFRTDVDIDVAAAASHDISVTLQDADDYLVLWAGMLPAKDIFSVTMDPAGVNNAFTKVMEPNVDLVGTLECWVLWGSDVPGGGSSYVVRIDVTDNSKIHGNLQVFQGLKEGSPERQGQKIQTFTDVKTYNLECDVIAANSFQSCGLWLPDPNVQSGDISALDGQTITQEIDESSESFAAGYAERTSEGTDVECDFSWANSIDEVIGGVVSISPSGSGGAGGTPVLAYATGVTRN